MPLQLSMFTPPVSWKALPVSTLPDLSSARRIAIDTEDFDPNLSTRGPGYIRGDAFVCGVSVAVDGWATYIPLKHYDGNIDNPDMAIKWLQDILCNANCKLFANAHYDMDALKTLGVHVSGEIYDVQVADSLILEDQPSFSLESIATRRLGSGKDDTLLKQLLSDTRSNWSSMPMLSAGHVAEYAIRDAELLLDIRDDQLGDISRLNLEVALARECKLTRVLWDMHQRGIPINVSKAEQTSALLKQRAQSHLEEARRSVPIRFNPDSSKSLAGLLQERGVDVPQTRKGNPSVSNDYLKSTGDEVLLNVYEYRRINKIRRDFIDGLFLEHAVRGRIHPQWFQSRHSSEADDEVGGAATGRITGSKPNLTQIPARDPELGPMCREIVEPEDGELYCKLDYSSQEPRITLHFAYKLGCPGAAEARKLFLDNKKVDFHEITRQLFVSRSGRELTRRQSKDINLGLTYAMGKPKLALKLGMDYDSASALFAEYHEAVPFIRCALNKAMSAAQERGYIITLGGRRRYFNQWEATQFDAKGIYDSREECLAIHGTARRALTHKALNSAVQGTAADQMKESLIQCWEAGYLPLLQVYDECGFSIASPEVSSTLSEIMENSLPMEVPALCEPQIGENWNLK